MKAIFLLTILSISAVASARTVGHYRLHLISENRGGRQPAFLFESEGGWRCRTQSVVSYRRSGRPVSAVAADAPSLLETPQVAAAFEREMEGGATEARLLVREHCTRGMALAWVSWVCAVGNALPDRLSQTRVIDCSPSHYSIPSEDPQSQLLRSLRNRSFRAAITLREKATL